MNVEIESERFTIPFLIKITILIRWVVNINKFSLINKFYLI